MSYNPRTNYNEVYEKHLAGKSISELAKEYGIHFTNIYSYFKRRSWKYNKEIPINKNGRYLNHDYLNNVDTERKAYFLGMMLADGWITDSRFGLKLKLEDKYLVEEILTDFSKGYKISGSNYSSFCISSKKIVLSLHNNNCTRKKSGSLSNIPNIDKNLIRHLIRGYFDGDGSISIRKSRPKQVQVYICSPNKAFLENLQVLLNENEIEGKIYMEKRQGKILTDPRGKTYTNFLDMYTLRLGTHQARIKFFEYLYKDSTIKMLRKFHKFKEYYDNTEVTTKISKGLVAP